MFLPGLRSLPVWTQFDEREKTNRIAYQDESITQAVDHLQQHWMTILEEYNTVAPTRQSDYATDTEHTLHEGTWDWHSYMTKGKLHGEFATHFKETFGILQTLRDANILFEGTPFGYSFFSTLHPRSRINAHCAPMNFRLRLHLPLIVPSNAESDKVGIRVGSATRKWVPGQALVFDDAFEHEVWNETDHARVLLLVDLWHPDVTKRERQEITQLFDHARRQGYMS